jgi:hypothetical protein
MLAAGTVSQIAVILGHERSQGAGQMKEDDEGIPFHTLLTVGMHRRDRISRRKMQRLSVLFQAVRLLFPGASAPVPGSGLQERGGAVGGRAGRGRGRRAGGAGPGRGGRDARAAASVPGGVLVVRWKQEGGA